MSMVSVNVHVGDGDGFQMRKVEASHWDGGYFLVLDIGTRFSEDNVSPDTSVFLSKADARKLKAVIDEFFGGMEEEK